MLPCSPLRLRSDWGPPELPPAHRHPKRCEFAASNRYLADRFEKKSPRAVAYIMALSQLLPLPLYIAAFSATTANASFGFLFCAIFTGDAYMGVAASTVATVMPSRMRARASLLYLATNTLVGGCGPLVVGVVLHNTPSSLQQVLIAVVAGGFTLSGLFFFRLSFLLVDIRVAALAATTNNDTNNDESEQGTDREGVGEYGGTGAGAGVGVGAGAGGASEHADDDDDDDELLLFPLEGSESVHA
jgi:hypothetical protein